MFINHSCAPNCETEEDDERIYITSLRDIEAGEELLYEYNLYDSDDDSGALPLQSPRRAGARCSPMRRSSGAPGSRSLAKQRRA